MVSKVLITGVSGLLGGYLLRIARRDIGHDAIGTWRSRIVHPDSCLQMEVTNTGDVFRVIGEMKPSVVIHCAGIGDVDYCEKEWNHARSVIVGGTQNVATAAKGVGAKLVYISSNAVYHGDAPPYSENSKRNPVNKYGWLKVDAENEVDRIMPSQEYMIARPIMLYGYKSHPLGRTNWALRLIEWLGSGKPVHMVNDVQTQPTYAYDCAMAIWTLVKNGQSGEWNIGGTDRMSLYRMSLILADVWNMEDAKLGITAVSSDYFKTMAVRPVDTTYDMTKLCDYAELIGRRDELLPRGVERGLRAMKASRA